MHGTLIQLTDEEGRRIYCVWNHAVWLLGLSTKSYIVGTEVLAPIGTWGAYYPRPMTHAEAERLPRGTRFEEV